MDSLHYALLAVVVLLAVYTFGYFRESLTPQERNQAFEDCIKNNAGCQAVHRGATDQAYDKSMKVCRACIIKHGALEPITDYSV